MTTLTKEALSTIVVVYQMGQGVPTYLFEGFDIIDALATGFVEEKAQALYLTERGQALVKSLIETGEPTVGTTINFDTVIKVSH